jgi:hypothetical protein
MIGGASIKSNCGPEKMFRANDKFGAKPTLTRYTTFLHTGPAALP